MMLFNYGQYRAKGVENVSEHYKTTAIHVMIIFKHLS